MIHLIVGNTGSGKTTYSKLLKKENKGVIFSIDKWNNELFMADRKESDGLDWFLERIERAEAMIMDLVRQLEDAEIDSILDLGLSKKMHRQKWRSFASENGFECKLHFLDVSKEIRLSRVHKRNKEQGDTYEFDVSDTNFEFMESWFEVPGDHELQDAVHIRS